MEEMKLQRIRELIIAIHSVGDDGLLFDTSKAQSLGYSEQEIDTANKILAMEPIEYLDELFKSKIIFTSFHQGPAPSLNVFYIGLAKLIFVINTEKEIHTYVTEEDLEIKVTDTLNSMVHLAYVMANTNNDAYGNPI